MPEGDTVFRAAQRLRRALCVDTPLLRAELRHPRLSTAELAGRSVTGVGTVGKHVFIRFSGDLSLHHHLRMDGTWQVGPVGARWRRPAHQARAVLAHAEACAVGFLLHDMRLLPVAGEHRLVAHLGPDLLDPQWSDQDTRSAAAALRADPRRRLVDVLLDQRVMAGLGNLYATEVCFLLGRTPWTPMSELDDAAAYEAVRLSRRLLAAGAERGVQSTTGRHTHDHRTWVYGRKRAGCFRCGGQVSVSEHGSGEQRRVAYFCPRCQSGPRT